MSSSQPIASPVDGLTRMRAAVDTNEKIGMLQFLDVDFTEVELGRAVLVGKPGVHLYNPVGTVHGGYAATLLDSACGYASFTTLLPGETQSTLEIKVAYLRAMTDATGAVRAEGKVVDRQGRTCFTEATLVDENGRLYATATSALLIFKP